MLRSERPSKRAAGATGGASTSLRTRAAGLALVLASGWFATGALAATACDAPEHRAFDFWLGEWQVRTPDGKLAGESAHDAQGSIWAIVLFVVLLAGPCLQGCSARQLYDTGQAWQRNGCDKIPDAQEHRRCRASTGMSYDEYRRRTEAAENAR